MKTSTAIANRFRCPRCQDETTKDETNAGFVRHLKNQSCPFEKGERDVFAPLPEPGPWLQTIGKDTGSLDTGEVKLEVGDLIEIKEEGKWRRVTFVMGSPGNWHANFKSQKAVPTGPLTWRIILRAQVGSAPPPPAPPPPPDNLPPDPSPTEAPKTSWETRLKIIEKVVAIAAGIVALIGAIIALIWGTKK